MMKYSLSLVATAFNEEELVEDFIRKSMKDLYAVADDFELVLIDDGSTDQTLTITKRLTQEFPQLKIISLGKNYGTGANYIFGFRAATKDIVFNNTVDAFFNTEDLPRILPYLENADVVSCYRTNLGANNLYQKILTLGNYFLIQLLFPLKLHSYQTAQFHRRDFFQMIDIESRSSFVSPELLLKAAVLGKSLEEVPVVFHSRKRGRAKGGKLKFIWRTFKDIVRFWVKWVIFRQPVVAVAGQRYYIGNIKR